VTSAAEAQHVANARRVYPRKKGTGFSQSAKHKTHEELIFGTEDTTVRRRMPGSTLGFEKILATTSISLPVSSYAVFAELRASHSNETWTRCYDGLSSVFDLKKWIFEKLLLPSNAYELSYAESGKAHLSDDMRLLSATDSLDMRTMATTRSVQSMYKGTPGLHSIDSVGVTCLYVRLKCRITGHVLNSFQSGRKTQHFGKVETQRLAPSKPEEPRQLSTKLPSAGRALTGAVTEKDRMLITEDGWFSPAEYPESLFHSRGYELFQASRIHGGHADVARIFLSVNKEPNKIMLPDAPPLSGRAAPGKFSL